MSTFKPTWLMVKMHADTKLLYFCKTYRYDPIRYKGSGSYWRNHIVKHGKDKVITIWHARFDDEVKLRKFASSFSQIFDIVKSPDWANQIDETGLDGHPGAVWSAELRKINSERTKRWRANNPEKVAQLIARGAESLRRLYRENPELGKKHSQPGNKNPMFGAIRPMSWREEHSRFMTENNPMKGRTGIDHPSFGKEPHNKGQSLIETFGADRAAQISAKISAGARNRKKLECPHCKKIGDSSNMKRWHFDNCKEKA